MYDEEFRRMAKALEQIAEYLKIIYLDIVKPAEEEIEEEPKKEETKKEEAEAK